MAPFFEDLNQWEKLSEIKPTLAKPETPQYFFLDYLALICGASSRRHLSFLHPCKSKVMIYKSRGEVSLLEQITIECVFSLSKTYT